MKELGHRTLLIRRKMAMTLAVALGVALAWPAPCLSQEGWVYCGPSSGNPEQEQRDLSDFRLALSRSQTFEYLKPSAVHGRQVDVTDTSEHGHYDFGDSQGISDQLLRLWRSTYVHNHSNEKSPIVTVQIFDSHGARVIGLAPPDCMSP